MWIYHPAREHDVVFQNQETFHLRIVRFPDDDVFHTGSPEEIEAYFSDLEKKHAKPKEKRIWMTGLENKKTTFPCPSCQQKLDWHITGFA